jgi:hypothetical protein
MSTTTAAYIAYNYLSVEMISLFAILFGVWLIKKLIFD